MKGFFGLLTFVILCLIMLKQLSIFYNIKNTTYIVYLYIRLSDWLPLMILKYRTN